MAFFILSGYMKNRVASHNNAQKKHPDNEVLHFYGKSINSNSL